jgi:hypothetical protein
MSYAKTYHRFDELPEGAKFVDNFGHHCIKTSYGTSAHCHEPSNADWYYWVDADR